MVLNVKESAKYISENAEHVKILKEGIEKLGKQLLVELDTGKLSPEKFSQSNFHPKSNDPCAVEWIFLVDTLNFCFWSYENADGWAVEGQTGYFALCAAINRAQKEGIDITNPNYYSKLTESELSHILRSDNNVTVPLLKQRLNCLHEVGSVLLKKYNGTFKTLIKIANKSAIKLLALIIENFPCFADESKFKGKKVGIYKRAQILIGDLWCCFKNTEFAPFTDISEISMFADYRVPQSLIYFGAIEYSVDLQGILESNMFLENGSQMEVEIRGCSIHAVELLNDWVEQNSCKKYEINSILIDHFLWDFRRKNAQEIQKLNIPFHKTLSIYY